MKKNKEIPNPRRINDMFKIERLKKIREIVFDRKQVEVTTLSQLLNVSDATIRNDLEELEKEGFLERFHGGATLKSTDTHEEINNTFNGSSIQYDKDKEEIGKVAAALVKEKEWIFLGPGKTSFYIAKALVDRNNINVLTNNLMVANILSNNYSTQILLLGGRLNSDGLYTIQDDISKELNNIYLSKAFFSVDSADLEYGYTLSDLNVLNLIKTVSSQCHKSIFVVDSKKFGKRSFMRLGDLDYPNVIVTNDNIPDAYKKYYLEHNITTYTSYDIKTLMI